MDRIDRAILELLQRDCTLEIGEIAERVGLSRAPCWRRIQRLRESGVISGMVALLDPRMLNLGTTVFVTVKTADHSKSWFARFSSAVAEIPEVIDLYRMSGEVDYLLRITVPDIDCYSDVYKRLIARCEFLDISVSFALETIKHGTALPLHHALSDRRDHRRKA